MTHIICVKTYKKFGLGAQIGVGTLVCLMYTHYVNNYNIIIIILQNMKLRSSSLSTSIEVINGGQNIVILPIRKGSVSQITSQFEVNTHNLEKYYTAVPRLT